MQGMTIKNNTQFNLITIWKYFCNLKEICPPVQHARNRSLHEELYHAYVTRASTRKLDNTPGID